MSSQEKNPLARVRAHNNDEAPFSGDLFERKALADRVTELVERLPDGGVIAIHAGWGEGKSWFARNWNAALKSQGFPTVYLDAFEADYVEDAFLLITAELLSVFEQSPQGGAERLREGAKKVASIVLPVLAKTAVKAVSVVVTGMDIAKRVDAVLDAVAESSGEQAGELISSAIKTRIAELQDRRKSVEGFRKNLSEAVAGFSKPLVFIIDELDRCKPPFAVQLIERIKHFFTVPKIVFVLFVNRPQLEASIRGLYGPDIDSNTYLSKFVTIGLTLPVRLAEERRRSEFAQRYCAELGKRLGYTERNEFGAFAEALAEIAPLFGMSFREIERAFVYYGFAGQSGSPAPLVAYLCALRVAKPQLWEILVENAGKDRNGGIYQLLGELRDLHAPSFPWILSIVRAAHGITFKGADGLPQDEKDAYEEFRHAFRAYQSAEEVFAYWARRLDLQV